MTNEYDLVVLGGGTGGYVAAIRASQLGMKVAVVENQKLGGTCLHKGCIPTKALLRSAEVLRQTKQASQFGIETTDITFNYSKAEERKNNIVNQLLIGVQSLMKKGKIDVYEGYGRILGPSIFAPMPGTISIEHQEGENTILIPKNVLIATGSRPRELRGLETDGKYILHSDHILQLEKLPKSIVIVGGGVIGIEWASMLADFGVKVTVIEHSEQILFTEDKDIVRNVVKSLTNRDVTIYTNASINFESVKKEAGVEFEIEINDGKQIVSAELALVAVGRAPNSDNIGLQNTSIQVENEFIRTNKYYQTEESHIYAVGDVIGGYQLAHVASHEGIIAVEHMANKNPFPLDQNQVPVCIYAFPEVARIGLTEKEARKQGYQIKVGKFPFVANGKALVYGDAEGFVKIISDQDTEDILGVHMVGPHVTDMISEAGLAKVLDATPWEITQNIYPHPSISEVIGEAALAVDGLQLHG